MPVDDGRKIEGTLSIFPMTITKDDVEETLNEVKKVKEQPDEAFVEKVRRMIDNSVNREKKKENSFGSFFFDEDGNEFYLKEVIYNAPVVVCNWSDGTKTTSKCDMLDTYSVDTGLTMCVLKKLMGGKFFARLLENWTPDVYTGKLTKITLKDVLKRQS